MSCTGEEQKHGLTHQKSVEQTPPSLAHQESFHKLTEFEKPWGVCRIDTNRRTETFTNILKNSLYGHGDVFHQVCMVDGSTKKILATYPPDFYPSSDQIAILEKAKMHPGALAENGIKLADKVYGYNRSEQSGAGRTSSYNLFGVYSGEDGKGGVMVFPTNNYIICGLWHAPPEECGAQKLENLKFKANELIEEVTDWLSSTGGIASLTKATNNDERYTRGLYRRLLSRALNSSRLASVSGDEIRARPDGMTGPEHHCTSLFVRKDCEKCQINVAS